MYPVSMTGKHITIRHWQYGKNYSSTLASGSTSSQHSKAASLWGIVTLIKGQKIAK
jgi:spore cortex formation protein SpoVR/YcgB (stage V sporulation)